MPIPEMRRLERFEGNLGAADILLATEDLAETGPAAARIKVQGARIP